MDKDKISYLADISTVCSQIRSMLNSTSVPKASLQKLSAKVSYLESLFIDTLLESTATTVDPGDDYNKKLQEARQQVLAKKQAQPVIPLVSNAAQAPAAPLPNAIKKLAETVQSIENSVIEDMADVAVSDEEETDEENVEPAGFTLASVVSPKKVGRSKKNVK